MKKIPLSRAKVGDVLAQPVLHGDGQILLGGGTTLAAHHMEIMRQRGVEIVTIVDVGADDLDCDRPASPLDPAALKEIVLEKSRWFGEARKEPVMAEIFRCVVNRAARGHSGQE